jgi:glycosyltransferase involved in cell wall biosynthesis
VQVVFDGRGAVRYRGTGIGTYTYRLLEELADTVQAPDRLLVCLPPGPRISLEETAGSQSAAGGRTVFWRLAGETPEEQQEELGELCTCARADVLHMPQNGRGLPRVGCAVVTTIHDLIPYLLPQTCKASYLRDCLREMPWVVRRSEKLIAVSRHTAGVLRDVLGVEPERIAVVYEGPEPGYLAPVSSAEKQRVAGVHGLPASYLLHVGGFSQRKNLGALVTALALIQRSGRCRPAMPDLVLAGEPGRDTDYIRKVSRALGVHGRLVLAGMVPVEDMPGLYAGASLVCCPSLEEGFSLPLVEAMAAGIPLVVSDIAVHREVAGDAAVYFDPCRPSDLAEALTTVLADADLRRLLASRGRERVVQFSWRRAALETWLVYRWAVGQRASGGS